MHDIGFIPGDESPRIWRWCRSVDDNLHAIFAVSDGCIGAITVDHDGNGDGALAAELKPIARSPGRICFFRSRPVFTDKKASDADRCGSAIRAVRHRAERRQIAIDEAGIDLALAKAWRTAQRA